MPGYVKGAKVDVEERMLKSSIYIDCACINQKIKKRLVHLTEMTVDKTCVIITGVDCFPINRRESDIILSHLRR